MQFEAEWHAVPLGRLCCLLEYTNYGSTINAYIHNKKITHAKYLLRFSDKNISEISEECGIGDSNYFSRMFKSVEGVSPAKYRLEW